MILKLIGFSHSHNPSVVEMVAKFIRRGIRKLNISKEYKVGFLDKLFGVGDAEKCPVCGSVLDRLNRSNPIDFKCPQCNVWFHKYGGELITSEEYDRRLEEGARKCEVCNSSLSHGDHFLPWERGNNAHAYIVCPSCGHHNILYGFGGED